MPERPRKRSRDSPDGPSEEFFSDRFHSERVDFARSQSNAQIFIAASNSSDKTVGIFLCKVSEAAKCLDNRHSKLAAADVQAASKAQAETAAADGGGLSFVEAHPQRRRYGQEG